MVAPVSSGSSATTPAGTTQSAAQKPLDKEAFLKLLVAQISHQDPTQPMQGTEFVAQLSQFAVVEQAIQQSSRLDALSTQLTGIANNDAVGLVGKTVTLRASGLTWDGKSSASSSVTLQGPAATTKVRIQDSNGQTVRTLDLGPRPAGALPVVWDGRTSDGGKAPIGQYKVVVEATDSSGKPVTTSSDMKGTVARVGFDKGYPELVLDTGATGPISDLVEVQGAPTTPR